MIGWVIGIGTLLVGGGIAAREMTKPTGDKVKTGDNVFVPVNQLKVLSNDPLDTAALKVFVDGFIATNVKVSNVALGAAGVAAGSILGLSPSVTFPLSSVTKIERNGTTFT